MATENAQQTGESATRVVVSYPEDLSSWGQFQIGTRHFLAYLRKTKDHVQAGDVWEEFLDVGCCGDTLDVPLRVESVEGGERMGPETEIVYEVREACGIRGGWQVQSAGGPNEI
ncbi:hypothetical protein A4G99_04095 [Haladaptatus sp. R4]|uniref:hypothetical protein n=1 Tax=Haladaptatus sp. R4 TaxID=1679489 RepID=UPI0007B4E650|nr:hypothetical protein [Haladaptatus sp. R4]KZN25650.1 hypothetical protein A4G99_04095 [Haladaptatus sp. R4]